MSAPMSEPERALQEHIRRLLALPFPPVGAVPEIALSLPQSARPPEPRALVGGES